MALEGGFPTTCHVPTTSQVPAAHGVCGGSEAELPGLPRGRPPVHRARGPLPALAKHLALARTVSTQPQAGQGQPHPRLKGEPGSRCPWLELLPSSAAPTLELRARRQVPRRQEPLKETLPLLARGTEA